MGLVPVQVAAWGGHIFINPAPEAPPLDLALTPMAGHYSHGERLGLPASEQALRHRLGHLRGNPRRLPKRLALPHQRPRPHPPNRPAKMGSGQSLAWLV